MQPNKVQRMIRLLSRLPGVGEKTAQRYVLFWMTADPTLACELGAELTSLHDEIRPCTRCGNLAEVRAENPTTLCTLCLDPKRDPSLLCVVFRVQDLLAIERSHAMRGSYFVLGKLLSPLEGVGPEQIPLDALIHRIRAEGVREVILATPPSVEGEATALLLKQELSTLGVSLSRIASGVPHGGDLEFADPITMSRAFGGRHRF